MARSVAQKKRILTTSALTSFALISGKEFDLDEIDDDLFYGGYFRFVKTLRALLKVAILKGKVETSLEKANASWNVAINTQKVYEQQYNKLKSDWDKACNDWRLKKMFNRRTIVKNDLPEDFIKTYNNQKLNLAKLKETNVMWYGDEYLKQLVKEVNSILDTKTYKKVFTAYAKFKDEGLKTKEALDKSIEVTVWEEEKATKAATKKSHYMRALPFILLGESLKEIVNEGEND